jgi:hypothetical protein
VIEPPLPSISLLVHPFDNSFAGNEIELSPIISVCSNICFPLPYEPAPSSSLHGCARMPQQPNPTFSTPFSSSNGCAKTRASYSPTPLAIILPSSSPWPELKSSFMVSRSGREETPLLCSLALCSDVLTHLGQQAVTQSGLKLGINSSPRKCIPRSTRYTAAQYSPLCLIPKLINSHHCRAHISLIQSLNHPILLSKFI